MAKVTAEKLLDLAKRSGLITEEKLDAFLAEAAERGDALLEEDELATALVDAGLLTRWQADKLLEGKHKGFLLGKYKLLGHIGKGGMSTVYLAEHLLMQRQVAIKVLPQDRVNDSSYLDRFRQEARAAAKLDDPNIVRAYDVDHQGKTHYLVMEYVDGRDLHAVVTETGPLDYTVAADFVAQAARGLQHAHEMNLVHRDIKPANLLVDRKRIVKVLDLGLAKFAETEDASLTLAHEEHVLGTADYLSPEQALNSHAADHRSDIYSLGCTLYFLLTGHPPFNEGSIRERLLKHQVETPKSIFKIRPDAPPGLVTICNRMMHKKADARYQTAGECEEVLSDWLEDRGYERGGPGGSGTKMKRVESDYAIGRFARPYPPTPAAETESASSHETRKLDDEEDIGFAPLPEEQERDTKPPSAAGSSSGVSSGISSALPGQSSVAPGQSSVAPGQSSVASGQSSISAGQSSVISGTGGSSVTVGGSDVLGDGPPSSSQSSASSPSLLEEELVDLSSLDQSGHHSGQALPSLTPAKPAGGEGIPHWVWWALVGVGAVIMILLILAVASG